MKTKLTIGIKKVVVAVLVAYSISVNAQISVQPKTDLSFNGTNQYVQVANNAAFETANITLEAWVQPDWASNATPSRAIVGMSQSGVTRYVMYMLGDYSGVELWNGSVATTFSYAFTSGQLYHIAMVMGGSSTTVYVNGSLVSTQGSTLASSTTGKPFFIGTSNGVKEYFGGNIEEVRVWNVALTQQQIRENMHLTLAGTETGLVSYYQFNEGTGTTTADAKSGFTGTLMNTPTWTTSVFPFGGGTSNTETEAAGLVNYTGTNLNATYSAQNGASVTTSIINAPAQAYNLPTGASVDSVYSKQYWVMNRFGTSTFTGALGFTVAETITAAEAANPSVLQLYQRALNSDGAWTYVASSDSVNTSTHQVYFTVSSISTLGQCILVKGFSLSTNTISGSPFCAPATLSVGYNATGITYNSGNVFNVQLSNASGSFTSPTVIGTLTSTVSAGTISATLDNTITSGTGYRIRVVSTNPVTSVITDNGTNLTITNPVDATTWTSMATGMMAWYKMNGNATDASGNNFNGSFTGTVTPVADRFGNANSALNFNGSSGMSVPDQAGFRIYTSFSISFWLKQTTASAATLIQKFDNTASPTEGYYVTVGSNGALTLGVEDVSTVTAANVITLNQWDHIVVEYNVGNTISIYVNGCLVKTGTAGGTISDNHPNAYIGYNGSGSYLKGSMDDIRIYSGTLLSSAQIDMLYNNGIASSGCAICQGSTINLDAATVTSGTYSWSGPNSYTSSVQNPVITNAPTTATGVYTLTVTKSGCTSPAQTTTVIVNAAPTITAADSARCSNGTLTLAASGATNGQYSWWTQSSGGTAISGQTNSTYTTPSLSATTSYWVSATNTSGCTSSRTQINAIINSPVNTALTLTGSANICVADSGYIVVQSTENNVSYHAYQGSTSASNSFMGTGGNITLHISPTALNTGLNTIKIKATRAGCGSVFLTDSVVIEKYVANVLIQQPVSISKCAGQTATFTVKAQGHGLNYEWYQGSTLLNDGGNISGSEDSILVISNVTLSDAGTYSCYISGDCQPDMHTNVVTLTVDSLPSITASGNGPLCAGDTLHLNSNTATGATYAWQGPNSFTSSLQNASVNGAATTASGNYTVTVTKGACSYKDVYYAVVRASYNINTTAAICMGDSIMLGGAYQKNSGTYADNYNTTNGCDSIIHTALTVNTLPTVIAHSTADTICSGQTVTLTGSGASSYTWTSGITNGTSFSLTTTQSYTVIGTDIHTCINTASITINVKVCSTGLEQASGTSNQITVYPNPVNDKLSIAANNNTIQSISVHSLDGKLLQKTNNVQAVVAEINLSMFEPGVYFIQIETTQGNTAIKKIIKQ